MLFPVLSLSLFLFQYVDLAKLTFPGKKTFHNMDRAVLEKRMKMLNDYLQIIVQPGVVSSHIGLMQLLLSFFEPGEYDKGVTGGQISRTVIVLPFLILVAVGHFFFYHCIEMYVFSFLSD